MADPDLFNQLMEVTDEVLKKKRASRPVSSKEPPAASPRPPNPPQDLKTASDVWSASPLVPEGQSGQEGLQASRTLAEEASRDSTIRRRLRIAMNEQAEDTPDVYETDPSKSRGVWNILRDIGWRTIAPVYRDLASLSPLYKQEKPGFGPDKSVWQDNWWFGDAKEYKRQDWLERLVSNSPGWARWVGRAPLNLGLTPGRLFQNTLTVPAGFKETPGQPLGPMVTDSLSRRVTKTPGTVQNLQMLGAILTGNLMDMATDPSMVYSGIATPFSRQIMDYAKDVHTPLSRAGGGLTGLERVRHMRSTPKFDRQFIQEQGIPRWIMDQIMGSDFFRGVVPKNDTLNQMGTMLRGAIFRLLTPEGQSEAVPGIRETFKDYLQRLRTDFTPRELRKETQSGVAFPKTSEWTRLIKDDGSGNLQLDMAGLRDLLGPLMIKAEHAAWEGRPMMRLYGQNPLKVLGLGDNSSIPGLTEWPAKVLGPLFGKWRELQAQKETVPDYWQPEPVQGARGSSRPVNDGPVSNNGIPTNVAGQEGTHYGAFLRLSNHKPGAADPRMSIYDQERVMLSADLGDEAAELLMKSVKKGRSLQTIGGNITSIANSAHQLLLSIPVLEQVLRMEWNFIFNPEERMARLQDRITWLDGLAYTMSKEPKALLSHNHIAPYVEASNYLRGILDGIRRNYPDLTKRDASGNLPMRTARQQRRDRAEGYKSVIHQFGKLDNRDLVPIWDPKYHAERSQNPAREPLPIHPVEGHWKLMESSFNEQAKKLQEVFAEAEKSILQGVQKLTRAYTVADKTKNPRAEQVVVGRQAELFNRIYKARHPDLSSLKNPGEEKDPGIREVIHRMASSIDTILNQTIPYGVGGLRKDALLRMWDEMLKAKEQAEKVEQMITGVFSDFLTPEKMGKVSEEANVLGPLWETLSTSQGRNIWRSGAAKIQQEAKTRAVPANATQGTAPPAPRTPVPEPFLTPKIAQAFLKRFTHTIDADSPRLKGNTTLRDSMSDPFRAKAKTVLETLLGTQLPQKVPRKRGKPTPPTPPVKDVKTNRRIAEDFILNMGRMTSQLPHKINTLEEVMNHLAAPYRQYFRTLNDLSLRYMQDDIRSMLGNFGVHQAIYEPRTFTGKGLMNQYMGWIDNLIAKAGEMAFRGHQATFINPHVVPQLFTAIEELDSRGKTLKFEAAARVGQEFVPRLYRIFQTHLGDVGTPLTQETFHDICQQLGWLQAARGRGGREYTHPDRGFREYVQYLAEFHRSDAFNRLVKYFGTEERTRNFVNDVREWFWKYYTPYYMDDVASGFSRNEVLGGVPTLLDVNHADYLRMMQTDVMSTLFHAIQPKGRDMPEQMKFRVSEGDTAQKNALVWNHHRFISPIEAEAAVNWYNHKLHGVKDPHGVLGEPHVAGRPDPLTKVKFDTSVVNMLAHRVYQHEALKLANEAMSVLETLVPDIASLRLHPKQEAGAGHGDLKGMVDISHLGGRMAKVKGPGRLRWMIPTALYENLKPILDEYGAKGDMHPMAQLTIGLMSNIYRFMTTTSLVHLKNQVPLIIHTPNSPDVLARTVELMAEAYGMGSQIVREQQAATPALQRMGQGGLSPVQGWKMAMQQNPAVRDALRHGVYHMDMNENLPMHKVMSRHLGLEVSRVAGEEPRGYIAEALRSGPFSSFIFDIFDIAMRTATYETFKEMGLSPRHAANLTNQHMIDYGMRYLTPKFRRTLRAFGPYMGWRLGNLGLHGQLLLKDPRKYALLGYLRNTWNSFIAPEDDKFMERYMSDYTKQGYAIPAFMMPQGWKKGRFFLDFPWDRYTRAVKKGLSQSNSWKDNYRTSPYDPGRALPLIASLGSIASMWEYPFFHLGDYSASNRGIHEQMFGDAKHTGSLDNIMFGFRPLTNLIRSGWNRWWEKDPDLSSDQLKEAFYEFIGLNPEQVQWVRQSKRFVPRKEGVYRNLFPGPRKRSR